MPPQTPPRLVAAVDLGSNSFHLLIGRVERSALGAQIYPIDSLKETVRLAAGLGPDKRLDSASQTRALLTLGRFGERLKSFSPDRVRVVATNTLRVAKNSQEFIRTAEAALGFPIEVIAGQEEARLIYKGVSHGLARDQKKRLIVDVGGGSTEFIIGVDGRPLLMESVYVGCVKVSRDFFPSGEITKSGFKAAVLEAREAIQVIARSFRELGWHEAIGSSGTARAIVEVVQSNGLSESGVTAQGLEKLQELLIRAGRAEQAHLAGLRQDRIPVFAGGVAIMIAIFAELGIDRMVYGEGALRLGVLYELVGESPQADMRHISAEQAMQRYGVDTAQARRVSALARELWSQISAGPQEENLYIADHLMWASCLHEIGRSISHNSFHKHSSYIVLNADLAGFSKPEQTLIAQLVLGQLGKITKLPPEALTSVQWNALLCFRLACLFYRSRTEIDLPVMRLHRQPDGFCLMISGPWLGAHPLTEYGLIQEQLEWSKMGIALQLQACQEGEIVVSRSSAGA